MTRIDKKNEGELEMISIPQFANKLGVSYELIRKMIYAGRIEAYDISPANDRKTIRIPRSELPRFLKSHRIDTAKKTT